MKVILQILLIALLARLCAMILLPWWGFVPGAALGAALLSRSTGQALLSGFCGLALLWVSYAISQDLGHSGRVGAQIAQLTGMPSVLLIWMMTAVIGGLVGALSAASGYRLRQWLLPVPERTF